MFRIKGIFPYLIAMFLNAFTDLGHKIIIQNTVFKVYNDQEQIMLTAIVNALVLLPYILLFTPAGFIGNKYPKNIIMKYAALFAIVVTLLITFCYYMGWFILAFCFTFVLAAQSAVYAPAKYGYIKELVGHKHISSGNAAVQSVTMVAILIGIIFYSVLYEIRFDPLHATPDEILKHIAPLGWLLVFGSIVEFWLTTKLPDKQQVKIKSRFDYKRYQSGFYLRKNMRLFTRIPKIYEAILYLSVFWAVSQVVLASFGAYAKTTMQIDNVIIVQGVMALAVVGIVLGSTFAATFSRFFINYGLLAFGAIGMSVQLFFLPLVEDIRISAFIFMLFGFFAGTFVVPLNAYIQDRSPRIHLGMILAGNNFVQNIFMFSFLVLTTLFAYIGFNSVVLFYLMLVLMLFTVYSILKKYLLQFLWLIGSIVLKFRYNISYGGLTHVPDEGAVVFAGNHVSWLDWFFIQKPFEKNIHFMIDRSIYHWRCCQWAFRLQGLIPISTKASKDAFAQAKARLLNDDYIAIFPEGEINDTKTLKTFNRGIGVFSEVKKAHIVPFYIEGVEGSAFARIKGSKPLFRRKINIVFGKAQPSSISALELQKCVDSLKTRD